MTKLTVAFRNFANAPKNSISKTKPNYPFFLSFADRASQYNLSN